MCVCIYIYIYIYVDIGLGRIRGKDLGVRPGFRACGCVSGERVQLVQVDFCLHSISAISFHIQLVDTSAYLDARPSQHNQYIINIYIYIYI